MSFQSISLSRKNDMDLLLSLYPNLIEEQLLKGRCYLLLMKNRSIISYDCRKALYKSIKLRGYGYVFNKQFTHEKSKVTTRHIQFAPSGIYHKDIQSIYLLDDEEFDFFLSKIRTHRDNLRESMKRLQPVIGRNDEYRYFCAYEFNVIVKVKPNGYVLNPSWCKASAVYNAEEELSLISPRYNDWTYYPGRMYFSRINWVEISQEDYQKTKYLILQMENDIFSWISRIVK